MIYCLDFKCTITIITKQYVLDAHDTCTSFQEYCLGWLDLNSNVVDTTVKVESVQ